MAKHSRSDSDAIEPPSKRPRIGPLTLDSLPAELLVKVLSELPISSLSKCQLVSRRFYKLATDSQIWKKRFYDRWVRPRALRIPGLRDSSTDPQTFVFSSKSSKWLGDEHLVREGNETNWHRQYRLRSNWSEGTCRVNEVEIAKAATPLSLVKLCDGIVFTADLPNGLRAWSARTSGTLLADTLLTYEGSAERKIPHALAVGKGLLRFEKAISIVIGFHDDTFEIFTFEVNSFVLRYSHPRGQDPDPYIYVSGIAFAGPYVATATNTGGLSIYRFEDEQDTKPTFAQFHRPNRLMALEGSNIGGIISLSLRISSQGVVVSVIYLTRTFNTGDLLIIQEQRLDLFGKSLDSRLTSIGMADLQIPGVRGAFMQSLRDQNARTFSEATSIQGISYAHPYLLVTHKDNTMTAYLVDSTPDTMTIRPGRRLWGHTAGISIARVSDRGRVVSVASFGDDMRIWELEQMMLPPVPGQVYNHQAGIQVHPVGLDMDERERIAGLVKGRAQGRRIGFIGQMLEQARFVGFDDEHVVTLKEKSLGTQTLSCYDFR